MQCNLLDSNRKVYAIHLNKNVYVAKLESPMMMKIINSPSMLLHTSPTMSWSKSHLEGKTVKGFFKVQIKSCLWLHSDGKSVCSPFLQLILSGPAQEMQPRGHSVCWMLWASWGPGSLGVKNIFTNLSVGCLVTNWSPKTYTCYLAGASKEPLGASPG